MNGSRANGPARTACAIFYNNINDLENWWVM